MMSGFFELHLVSSCSPRVAVSHGNCESVIHNSSEKICVNTIENTQLCSEQISCSWSKILANLCKLLHMQAQVVSWACLCYSEGALEGNIGSQGTKKNEFFKKNPMFLSLITTSRSPSEKNNWINKVCGPLQRQLADTASYTSYRTDIFCWKNKIP